MLIGGTSDLRGRLLAWTSLLELKKKSLLKWDHFSWPRTIMKNLVAKLKTKEIIFPLLEFLNNRILKSECWIVNGKWDLLPLPQQKILSLNKGKIEFIPSPSVTRNLFVIFYSLKKENTKLLCVHPYNSKHMRRRTSINQIFLIFPNIHLK